VGIGTTTPVVSLQVNGTSDAPSKGDTPNGSLMLGTNASNAVMSLGVTSDVSPRYGWIQARSNPNNPYHLALQPNGGSVGVGTTAPAALLDLDGPSGDALLRLRVSKTPTGSADPSGSVGSFAWDDNYVYVKTNTGWRRAALGAW
jgi:hypothetical protein